VRLYNLPGVTVLPEFPAATEVWLCNLPGVTVLPELPAATEVGLYNLPGVTVLPELPAATEVGLYNLPGVTVLPELPAATEVGLYNLPGISAGKDSRGYWFVPAKIKGEWRIIAGCRNLSIDAARKHWGPGGVSDRPDCLKLVERCVAMIGMGIRHD